VLDFSAGFGGRLLGCLTLRRRYVGIDPAKEQIHGLRSMLSILADYTPTRARVIKGCAEDVMPRISPESIDLIFSSPPYFNVEKYSADETQSYRRYRTYKGWKENFLNVVLTASYKLLRRGGHLVINVANTPRHAIASDIGTMVSPSLRKCIVLRLLMHSRPSQCAAGETDYRWEPVLVFRKTA